MTPYKRQKIVDYVAQHTRTFGGGKNSGDNPIAAAMVNQPYRFALGVDVGHVVDLVLQAADTVNESTIRKNRRARWCKLDKARETRVYARAPDEYCGYIIGEVAPYHGEPVDTARVRILWPNGRVTLPCKTELKKFRRRHWRLI